MQLLFNGKIHLDYLHIDFPNISSVFMDFKVSKYLKIKDGES